MTTIKPFLMVNNGKKAVAFYQAAFEATESKRWETSSDKISSVLEIENAQFYVADEDPANGNFSPHSISNSSIRLILNTEKADVFFERALKLGATEICPMTTESDWRIGKLKDPFGHIWEIGYVL
jgi:PhnB protein